MRRIGVVADMLVIACLLTACSNGEPSLAPSGTVPSPAASTPSPNRTTTTFEAEDFRVGLPPGEYSAAVRELNTPRGKVSALTYEGEDTLILTYQPGINLSQIAQDDARRFMQRDLKVTDPLISI